MISEAYREQNRLLHETDKSYGISGLNYADPVREISNYGRLAILDYGCGKETLKRALGPAYKVAGYDPCLKGLDTRPEPHDVVVCTDVMEHVEPEFVDDVLRDLRGLTRKTALFSISVVPAQKFLADGRNAHVTILSVDEWKERVKKAGFSIESSHDDTGQYNTFGLICT